MDFSWTINALKAGQKVTRKVWAGDPSYIELTAPGSNSIIAVGDDTQVENWLCLHSDIFADDWEEYKDVEVKLPKAGSMENCEKLSNAINQLLESIGVMPHLTVTLVPGPEDKELLISIEERSDHGASNFPLYVADVDGIIKTNIGSPVKITKPVAGGYEVEDMQINLGKED